MTEQVNKKSAYYDDGFYRNGKVSETDKTPEVNFTYRPIGVGLDEILNSYFISEDPKKLYEGVRMLVKNTIVDWDLEKPDGSKVDWSNDDELKKVDPYVMERIAEHIKTPPAKLDEKIKN